MEGLITEDRRNHPFRSPVGARDGLAEGDIVGMLAGARVGAAVGATVVVVRFQQDRQVLSVQNGADASAEQRHRNGVEGEDLEHTPT